MENLEQNQPQPAAEKPTAPEITSTPTPEVTPQKSSILLPILLSLLMFLLGSALVFAYFVFLKPEKVAPQPVASPTPIPSPTPSPSPSPDITAGWEVYRNEEAEKKYSLRYPEDWIISREHKDLEGEARQAYDTTTLTKGDYKISISQFLGGVGSCLFPEDPDKEGMYGRYGDYVEMEVAGKIVRRTKKQGFQDSYYFCEKKNGEYVGITSVGVIGYKVPLDESEEMLREMDSIVKSIQLIN